MSDNSQNFIEDGRYPVNSFDLSTDLFCSFSDQIIHMVIYFNGPLSYELLLKAVEKASLTEPITRCRIIRDQDSLWWQEIASFSIDEHVLRLFSRDPKNILYQALSYPLDPYAGKLFQVILIENSDGNGDILVINTHHIAMDGKGLKDFAGLIMKFYADYQAGCYSYITPTPLISRQLPKISTIIPENMQIRPSDPPLCWCSDKSVPLQSLEAVKYLYSILTLDVNRTANILNIRKEWNITVNDLMIAAIAMAIADTTGMRSDIEIPLYTTIDLRRYLSKVPKRSLVNFSTSFKVRITIKPEDTLEDIGKKVHILMSQIKSENPGLSEAIDAEKLLESGYCIAEDLLEKHWNCIQNTGCKTTIFSNTGIINSFPVSSGEPSVKNAVILPGFFKPPGFFFTLSTYDDIMTISGSYAIPAYNPDIVQPMFRYIDEIIPGYFSYPGEYEVIG